MSSVESRRGSQASMQRLEASVRLFAFAHQRSPVIGGHVFSALLLQQSELLLEELEFDLFLVQPVVVELPQDVELRLVAFLEPEPPGQQSLRGLDVDLGVLDDDALEAHLCVALGLYDLE